MRNRSLLTVVFVPIVSAILACGGSDTGATPTPAPAPSPSPSPSAGAATINIQGMAFSPLSLQVAPGTVVTVHNLDAMPHSVTSETAPGSYRPGAVSGVSFDTGAFQQTATFTIPANAPVGTVVPYYCSVHLGTMATPNGEIRVIAAGTAPTTAPATPAAPAAPMSPY